MTRTLLFVGLFFLAAILHREKRPDTQAQASATPVAPPIGPSKIAKAMASDPLYYLRPHYLAPKG